VVSGKGKRSRIGAHEKAHAGPSNKGLQTDSPPVTPLAVQSHRIGRISSFGFDQHRRRLELSQGRARRPAAETNVMQIGWKVTVDDGLPESLLIALGYGVVLCVGACSLCFLALFVLTYFVMGFGDPFAWSWGLLPGIVTAGLLGSFTYPWYRNRTTTAGKWAVYAGSVIGAILLGIFVTNAFSWLVEQWRWANGSL
jgi:hypothetical protein